ncbi:hypothetical protein D7V92_03925 [Parabacteroides sp. CH2-D42-20]|nr:hypothetical protein D7V92_03925 [Parabacteroides sp. CH2-D42-20]
MDKKQLAPSGEYHSIYGKRLKLAGDRPEGGLYLRSAIPGNANATAPAFRRRSVPRDWSAGPATRCGSPSRWYVRPPC